MNWQLGGPHSRFGRFGGEIYPFPLLGIKPGYLGRFASSLVTVLTSILVPELWAEGKREVVMIKGRIKKRRGEKNEKKNK